MGYQACDICSKDITNDEQFYLCRECWDKEHLKSPSFPQPDELGKLIELCNERLSSEGAMADTSFLNSIKILAMQAANNREVYNRAYVLEDRIKKLEEHESRCHGEHKSGDPADINPNPQANNPLTKEEISILVSWFDVLMEKYAHYYIDRAIKLKLESYLETK
jgi:hypothetical protein